MIAGIVDLVFFAIGIAGYYAGYERGILKAFTEGLIIFLAIILSIKINDYAQILLLDFFQADIETAQQSPFIPLLAFVLSFIFSMTFIRFLLGFIKMMAKSYDIEMLNKVGGGIIMTIFSLFLYSGLLWFLAEANVLKEKNLEGSMVFGQMNFMLDQFQLLMLNVIDGFKKLWQEILDLM